MGSYLSQPVTAKESSEESNDKLQCGASSMQGWRVNQEDAHNVILNFDEDSSFFAVYDGHGGHEVAHHCSQKLPDFIKNTESYKSGNIEQALIDGFLGFDASITDPEIISALKEIAGEKGTDEDSEEEENVDNLYEEASMPIEKVIEKYTNLLTPAIKNLKKGEKLPRSPMIMAKKDAPAGSSSNIEANKEGDQVAACSTSDASETKTPSITDCSHVKGDSEVVNKNANSKPEPNGSIPEIVVTAEESSPSKDPSTPDNTESKPNLNGDISEEKCDSSENSTTNRLKGKSPMKKQKTPINTRPKRNATQLYKKLLDFGNSEDEDETEDDDDKTFMEPKEESDDSETEGVNTSIDEPENSEEESSDEDGDDEMEEEEDEELEDENDENLEFARNMKEEPGSDSGCTAVIALLKGKELYVANAGDSRCVVCRNGKAVDMSFDHKPEDEPERERIIKAGGKVTADGRVNGGLNLSRAIGDHAYKQNKELSDKEQMITALPDIKTLTINPTEDEFMILACDGIWNFMSSQDVINFVKERLDANSENLSKICEEMFDHCLAPNTMGDGTGCDNMTAIIVRFKSALKKRGASPEPASTESKRAKTEEKTTAAPKTDESSESGRGAASATAQT